MITTVTMNTSIDKAYFMDHEVQNGTVMRVSRCRNSAGGKGLNVARAVKLCGEKVQATGLAGGFNGKYLESLLEKDEVQYQFLHIAGETRCCINILVPAPHLKILLPVLPLHPAAVQPAPLHLKTLLLPPVLPDFPLPASGLS